MLSGKNHPDRDAQFQHIDRTVNRFIKNAAPVISVDTKKKELVGNFKNNGKTWEKSGNGIEVLDHGKFTVLDIDSCCDVNEI